jgi:hypothetical protein
MIASIRGRGERADAHRGPKLVGETAQMVGDEVRAAETRGEGCCGEARGPLDARIGRGTPCGGNQGVKTDQDATTMRNSDGGAAHRRRFLREIRSMPRHRASMLGSRSFWMARGNGHGVVVVRGAAERLVGGEAEASARRREEGGGSAAGLQRCCCG